MFIELFKIAGFIWQSIIHVWPYLLISVPFAVLVKMSGASKYIGKAFNRSPLISILLSTVVGAFSPFCSCSVIPVVASLLIGGVPIAPVMSFWLASPSMDPEMFFLSVSMLGWQMAIWRIGSAFAMSFMSGLITHLLVKRGWITEEATLKAHTYSPSKESWKPVKECYAMIKKYFTPGNTQLESSLAFAENSRRSDVCGCNSAAPVISAFQVPACGCQCIAQASGCGCIPEVSSSEAVKTPEKRFIKKLATEAFSSALMVVKFMILAYFLEALIVLYIPESVLASFLGGNSFVSIIMAAVAGVPVYTSTMPALALVGGLISKGMAPAAGLAFLISGPTTTIPAMAAVWNLANRKVFFLYVGFTLAFAILSGLLYYAVYPAM
ncbi:MAG: hypothetical protein HF300_06905 [Ignavibacteria bacterium]|nr:hypothetical protein [Ignavibacteria bacterium]MCU7512267.1 hypothetical protein [Ignavibacteria bacterium]MCU7520293.1 hypothetical protein [Ignavibacteria bacterium]